jgi:hypothetical protein
VVIPILRVASNQPGCWYPDTSGAYANEAVLFSLGLSLIYALMTSRAIETQRERFGASQGVQWFVLLFRTARIALGGYFPLPAGDEVYAPWKHTHAQERISTCLYHLCSEGAASRNQSVAVRWRRPL